MDNCQSGILPERVWNLTLPVSVHPELMPRRPASCLHQISNGNSKFLVPIGTDSVMSGGGAGPYGLQAGSQSDRTGYNPVQRQKQVTGRRRRLTRVVPTLAASTSMDRN